MAQVAYSERLWPSPGVWLAVSAAGALVGLVLVPVSTTLAVVVGVLAVAAAVAATALATPRVEVVGGELRAGAAHVPVALLGTTTPLTGTGLREALGPGLDARAYVCLRGWVRGAVRVELDDPADPTPYWIVSTRRPGELAAALRG